jgi:hypothetical protein
MDAKSEAACEIGVWYFGVAGWAIAATRARQLAEKR